MALVWRVCVLQFHAFVCRASPVFCRNLNLSNGGRQVSTCSGGQDHQTLQSPTATTTTTTTGSNTASVSQPPIVDLLGQPFHSTHPHIMQPNEVTPGITVDELRGRRSRLMEAATASSPWPGCHHVLLLPSAAVSQQSDGIAHPFRQSADLLYASGCQEADSLLLLHTGPRRAAPAHTSLLFVAADGDEQRRWEGGRTGAGRHAASLFGVDAVLPAGQLCGYMECLARELGRAALWYDFRAPSSVGGCSVAAADALNMSVRDFLGVCAGSRLESPRALVQRLRLIKSPAEQRLLRAAAAIASAAVRDAMAACTTPGVGEQQLHATLERGMRWRGSQRPAFPPVVAGDWRSTIIHYTRNDHPLAADNHVLVDVGCELHGYCSDVSRCWPVGGRFTPAQQQLYERLLHVQTALLDVVHNTRPSLETLYACMLRLLAQQLADMRVLGGGAHRSSGFQFVQRYCPHHVGHYLGMDVHDTQLMPKNVPLKPGMCITIEPGLYIRHDDTDAPREFRGLGFRLEDVVLITDGGCEVLTADCPKTLSEIELCRQP